MIAFAWSRYLNPFDSCCWLKEMESWVPRIKAIKERKPDAVVLATFHATEIWNEDLVITPGNICNTNPPINPCFWVDL